MENLPVEILTVILLLATNPGQRRLRRRMSLVCRTWSTIIAQSPLFWTEIGLHRSAKEFQEVLRRNPAGPLDVSWTPGNIFKPVVYSAEELMKLVSPESHRWRSLTLAGNLSDRIQTQLVQVPTPRLTDINICHIQRFHGSELPNIHLTPEGYPLRSVVLGYVALDWDCSRMTGLRSLRIQGLRDNQPTLSQLHKFISSSPELEVLALTAWDWKSDGSAFTVPSLPLMALNFLKTLILDSLDPAIVEGISLFIIASSCNNLKLHRIRGTMVEDQSTTSQLAGLLRGPLKGASALFLSYNQLRGEIMLGEKEEGEELGELDIREATSKLAKRHRVYFNMSLASAVQSNESQPWSDLLRRAVRNVLQQALSGLNVPIQFKLQGRSYPRLGGYQKLPNDIFLDLPLTRSLKLFDLPGTISILDYLASPQPLSKEDGDTGSLAWPCPRLEKITVLCGAGSCKSLRHALNRLLSNRTGCLIEGRNGHSCGCQLGDHHHPSIKEIVIRHFAGSEFHMWSKGQWKRLVDRATQTEGWS